MTIHIEALTFDVIIGLLDFERERVQRVVIDVDASYVYSNELFIDYADMVFLIEKELKEGRYILLEEALQGIKEILYTAYPHIQTLRIKLSKPDILPKCQVALSHTWDFSKILK